jgi:hypothetical protein
MSTKRGYIINPITGRQIKIGGSTHQSFIVKSNGQIQRGAQKSVCQIKYNECLSRNGPPAPERDWFGCQKCDRNGYYVNLTWSHPMAKEKHCLDPVTGKEISGTRRDRNLKLDCKVYQKKL